MLSQTNVVILAITAHHASREPYKKSFREQMKNSPIDYKLVYGTAKSNDFPEREPLEDELFFDVDDRREYMVLKNQAMFRWALEHGYTHVFRCCDDTVLHPDRLLQHLPLLAQHDYAGTFCGHGSCGGRIFALRYMDYCHGGVGMLLSCKAMERLIANSWGGPDAVPWPDMVEVLPNHWNPGYVKYWDDLWIGEVLKGNLRYGDRRRNNIYENYGDISVYDDPNLFAYAFPFDRDAVIATHEEKAMGHSELNLIIPPFSSLTDKVKHIRGTQESTQKIEIINSAAWCCT